MKTLLSLELSYSYQKHVNYTQGIGLFALSLSCHQIGGVIYTGKYIISSGS